jgi:hypothetical protein
MESPAGRLPEEIDHVSGVLPPEEATVCEYAVPTVPAGNAAVVMRSLAGLTTMESAFVTVFAGAQESITLTVKFDVPYAVGVPEITPVPAAIDRPAGRLPELIDHA